MRRVAVRMMLYTNCKLRRLIIEFVLVAKGTGVRLIFETRGTKADEIWGTRFWLELGLTGVTSIFVFAGSGRNLDAVVLGWTSGDLVTGTSGGDFARSSSM
jgi:hypothetical protein